MPNNERLIDVGGQAEEEPYDGPLLVIFAIDPGVSTGWSALKVPVGLLGQGTVGRVLARCRHQHGTVLRSGAATPASGAGSAYSPSDSPHVTAILDKAREIYEEWMPEWENCEECGGEGRTHYSEGFGLEERLGPCRKCEGEGGEWDYEAEARFLFVVEGFDLRLLSQDPALLAPVRVASLLMDRLWMSESVMSRGFQKVADAKNVVTDARLKGWGLYDKHSSSHARDADRHGVLFLRKFVEDRSLRIRVFGFDPLPPLPSLS